MMFVKTSDTSSSTSFHETLKKCNSIINHDIKKAFPGLVTYNIKPPSSNSAVRMGVITLYTFDCKVLQSLKPML